MSFSQPPRRPSFRCPPPTAPPNWRRPLGVAAGTWAYSHQRSIADHYDQFVADTALCQLDIQILQQWLPPPPVGQKVRIVDLGCGSGRVAIKLAESGFDVLALDLSQSMLRVLKAKLPSCAMARDEETVKVEGAMPSVHCVRVNLVQMDGFQDQSVDHAICLFSTLGMIQGREHRRSMLLHARRMVRLGGRLILHVHHRASMLSEPGGWRRLLGSWWQSRTDSHAEYGDQTYCYRGVGEMFMHRFSCRELIQDLRATGWKMTDIRHLSIDGSETVAKPRWAWEQIRVGGMMALAEASDSAPM